MNQKSTDSQSLLKRLAAPHLCISRALPAIKVLPPSPLSLVTATRSKPVNSVFTCSSISTVTCPHFSATAPVKSPEPKSLTYFHSIIHLTTIKKGCCFRLLVWSCQNLVMTHVVSLLIFLPFTSIAVFQVELAVTRGSLLVQ